MSTYRARTLVEAIEEAAASTKTGYRFIEEASQAEPFFTHGGIERASARYGGALQALGARKGDRVALILPDNADFVFAFLGAIRAGIIPVPIYPPTGLGKLAGYLENTLHIVARSGAKILLTNAEVKRMLGTIQAQAPELQKVIAVEGIRSSREELQPVKVSLDDTAFLQFTSGSTSRPKGVVLTHRNLAANVRAIMERGIGIRDGVDSGVSWLPLYHDMGLIGMAIGATYAQVSSVIMSPVLFLKRPTAWLDALSRHGGTISFAPNFAYELCVRRVKPSQIDALDLSRWRVAGCGAEPIRAENLQAFADKFAKVGFDQRAFISCYGMAESTLAISFSKLGTGVTADVVDGEALWSQGRAVTIDRESPRAASIVQCGPAFEGHEIQVFGLDDDIRERPLGERCVGEIRLRGPSVTAGYFNEIERTQESFAGGWLRTGDLGYLADGNVHICGRSKEVIIVNGRNYYPQDLEWEAGKVEGVRKGNVVAFGTLKPHNDRERVVITFETVVTGDAPLQALKGEVRRVVQQALGLTVDDVVPLTPGLLPKTTSGKLQRGRTRELYETGTLLGRTSARGVDTVEVAKELARSQLGYFRHALLGGKKSEG